MPDLEAIGDAIRNGLKTAYADIRQVGSDVLTGLDALGRRSYLKPLLYGGAIGGGLALGGLGAGEAIHSLEVSNFGGQPLNPYDYDYDGDNYPDQRVTENRSATTSAICSSKSS